MGYFYSAGDMRRVCRIDSDGYIFDSSMTRIGRIHPDGYIFSERYERIGRVEPDGRFYNEQGERLGRIHQDGRVYAENYEYLGRLEEDVVKMLLHTNETAKSTPAPTPAPKREPVGKYHGYETRGGYELGRNANIAGVIAIPLGILVGRAASSFWIGVLAVLLLDTILLAIFDTMWAKNHNRSVFQIAGQHYFWLVVLICLCVYLLQR